MDSSSDGSFAWTEASDDSTENEMIKTNMNASQSGEESESGKSYKKILQQQLFKEHNNQEINSSHPDERPRKRKLSGRAASPARKRIKTEPESDVDKSHVNKHRRSLECSRDSSNDAYDESYLDLKVKNEQNSTVETSAKRKRKRNKSVSISDGDISESQKTVTTINNNVAHNGHINHEQDLCAEEDENISDSVSKKKKKKSKKRRKHSTVAQESDNEDSFRVTDEGVMEPVASEGPCVDSHTLDNERRMSDDTPGEARLLINSGHTSDEDTRHQSKLVKRQKKNIDCKEHNDDSDIRSKSPKISSKSVNDKKSKLKAFIESNAHLRPCPINLAGGSVLGDDDEVWVIQCPKDVEIEAFQDKEWAPASGRKIKLDGRTYEGDASHKRSNVVVLGARDGRATVGRVALAGCVRLRPRLPKSVAREAAAAAERAPVALPPTKRRHPLFGPHYKRATRLPAAAAERLRAAAAARLRAPRGKRDRRLSAPPAPPAALPAKKKKSAAWDSAKAIEETLFSF